MVLSKSLIRSWLLVLRWPLRLNVAWLLMGQLFGTAGTLGPHFWLPCIIGSSLYGGQYMSSWPGLMEAVTCSQEQQLKSDALCWLSQGLLYERLLQKTTTKKQQSLERRSPPPPPPPPPPPSPPPLTSSLSSSPDSSCSGGSTGEGWFCGKNRGWSNQSASNQAQPQAQQGRRGGGSLIRGLPLITVEGLSP